MSPGSQVANVYIGFFAEVVCTMSTRDQAMRNAHAMGAPRFVISCH